MRWRCSACGRWVAATDLFTVDWRVLQLGTGSAEYHPAQWEPLLPCGPVRADG